MMTQRRQTEGAGQRERIDSYLQRSGLADRSPRVVPLTGDASDRRYFRVLIANAPSIVLSPTVPSPLAVTTRRPSGLNSAHVTM